MDRSLISCFLLCLATACASSGSEPTCAKPPTPAPSHPEDLVDTTEKEALPVKPASDDAPPPAAPEAPAPAGTSGGAECVIPEKECDTKEACPELEELCHTIGDPIARNDAAAFQKVVASGSGLENKGEPRASLGFGATGPVKITLVRDCTRCRRRFVSFSIESGGVKGLAMVDSNQITSWAKGK